MTREERKLTEIVDRIIEIRSGQVRLMPSWIATEAMQVIDPARRSVELAYLGCHLQLRQIARARCRKKWGPDAGDDGDLAQGTLFEGLQWRYPAAHSHHKDEPEYVLREHMSAADVDYNVARLRAEARAKLDHADALEAWGRARGRAA